MRKKISFMLVFMLIFSMAMPMSAFADTENNISITIGSTTAVVNGVNVTLDSPPKIINNRTMVPIRFISESMGMTVGWENATKKITVDDNIILYINSDIATVDGKQVVLDSPPTILNNRTMVPIRFISENMGAEVGWDQSTQTVSIKQVIMTPEVALTPSVFLASNEDVNKVLNSLDTNVAWSFAKQMVAIGSEKNGLGFRMGGTVETEKTAKLVADKFKSLGLDVETHQYNTYAWRYLDASMAIAEKPELKIPIVGTVGSNGTDKDGITGELIYAGNGTKAELDKLDLTGKIALVAMDFDLLPWYQQAGTQAEEHGAIGTIYYTINTYGQNKNGEAFAMSDYQGKIGETPLWNVPKKYGEQLKDLLVKEKLNVTLTMEVEINPNAKGNNVIATIKGSKYPDEYVILNAHMDAFFSGWQDDTLATSTLIAVADGIVKSGYKPDRSIVFMAFDGEEWGSPNTIYGWLAGSWHLMKDYNARYAGKTVGSITFESMAYTYTDQLKARASDSLFPFVKTVAATIKANNYSNSELFVKNVIGTWSDEWSLAYYGIPSMRTDTDSKFINENYHSQFDQPELADIRKYENCLDTYATMTVQLDKVVAMPYDLSSTPDKFINALNLDLLVRMGLSHTLTINADNFKTTASKVYKDTMKIAELYAIAKADKKDLTEVDKMLNKFNKELRDAAKTMISGVNQLQGENVVYGTPYFQDLLDSANKTIAALEIKDGKTALSAFDFPGAYYAEFMDYTPWHNIYRETFDGYKGEKYWGVTALETYDIYDLVNSIRAKAGTLNANYSNEIAALKVIKTDVEQNLRAMALQDANMWVKSTTQLPTNATQIIEALK